jgi:O-antigen/teichoic acid export membrane protein
LPLFSLKVANHTPSSPVRNKTIKGGVLLTASKGITQVCVFARNVIIARAIGVENFGIAALFSMTVAILDMLGSLSLGQMLIQAKDGEDEKLQATAHALSVVRGVVSGLLLLACASPLAALFGVPEAVNAFRWLALIPVLRGLAHLDQQRLQREMKYRAAATLDITRELLPLALAWPLCVWLKDYSAMLWLLVLQSAVTTMGSYWVADRKYRWHWDRELTARFLRFGWPLAINSLLLFFIFQGDRLLIGSARTLFGSTVYTLHELGVYSIALSLTLIPTMALGNISTSLMLPLFSAVQSNPADLQRRYLTCSQIIALISGLFALPFIICGGWLVTTIYGSDYAAAGTFIGWLAVAQTIRMARYAPTSLAMARADTTNALYSNLVRCMAFIVTVLVVAGDGALHWIAMAGCLGELAAWLFCLWRLRALHLIPMRTGLAAYAPIFAFMGGGGLLLVLTPEHAATRLLLLGLLLVIFMITMLKINPFLKSLIRLRDLRSFLSQSPKPITPVITGPQE